MFGNRGAATRGRKVAYSVSAQSTEKILDRFFSCEEAGLVVYLDRYIDGDALP